MMMNKRSDEGRARAEALFKRREQQSKESEKVWAEHAAAGRAADANRAKLKALRLARDTADKGAVAGKKPKKAAAQTSDAPAMDALIKQTREHEVLPTHRQVPTKATTRRVSRKKDRPST
jgi:hypothetical protein